MNFNTFDFFSQLISIMAQLLCLFWPLTLVIGATLVIPLTVAMISKRRSSRSGITKVDKLNGDDFERYLEILFKKLGYQVHRTPYQGDYGADLILTKDNEKTAVQAKRYKQSVGVKAIQEVNTAQNYYGCTKAMVVTNSYFTHQARNLARANQVELWDRNELVKRLLALNEDINAVPHLTTTVQMSVPTPTGIADATCAQCGKPVSAKVRDYCLSHGSSFNGKIYCYEHQKQAKRQSLKHS